MQKKSSIDCKLFAINDLAGQKAGCSTISHSCSECRHRPACLRTAQLASFSLPRCLFFWAGLFDRGQGAFSPAIEPEFANSVAITTFLQLFGQTPLSPNSKASISHKWRGWHTTFAIENSFFWILLPGSLAVRTGNASSAVEATLPMSVAAKPSRPPRTQEFSTVFSPE